MNPIAREEPVSKRRDDTSTTMIATSRAQFIASSLQTLAFYSYEALDAMDLNWRNIPI